MRETTQQKERADGVACHRKEPENSSFAGPLFDKEMESSPALIVLLEPQICEHT